MAPLAPFPCADLSYPNGAIVSFSGTDYVFAGGQRLCRPSAGALAAVQRVDHATVLDAPAGAAPPTAKSLRSGTLVFTSPVDGKPAIYVAGTDGQLHGFATPAQLLADGYDVALVVTVPSLSGLRVGPDAAVTGPSATALATSADGAIVASSGTYYVFAGGRAFAVPTPAALAAVQVSDMAKTLIGPVSPAQIGSGIANGTLLSAPGGAYVGYEGNAYPFKAMSQLAEDGYSGTAAVPVPATAGVNVVFPYSGS